MEFFFHQSTQITELRRFVKVQGVWMFRNLSCIILYFWPLYEYYTVECIIQFIIRSSQSLMVNQFGNMEQTLIVYNLLHINPFATKSAPIERARWELSTGSGFISKRIIWRKLGCVKLEVPKIHYIFLNSLNYSRPYNSII